MSIKGLTRRPHYEEVLDLALKDQGSQHGLLSVPMLKYAAAINNPLFQRVQSTIGEDLSTKQKQIVEQRAFDNNLTRLSVEA